AVERDGSAEFCISSSQWIYRYWCSRRNAGQTGWLAALLLAELRDERCQYRHWLSARRHYHFHRRLRRRHHRQLGLQRVGDDAAETLLPRPAIPGGLHLQQVDR